ncbi:hypothetical protein MHYP_G00090230 [Metynnis hypsauchen]
MAKYRYALISWTKGPDKDAISIVPTSWIIDFDPADTSRAYPVECRMTNTKKPVNGWQVEHAVVLQLADHKRPRKPKRLFFDEDEDAETNCETARKKKPKLAAQRQAEEEILFEDSQLAPGIQSPEGCSSNESAGQIRDLQIQMKALQKENTRLRHMVVKDFGGCQKFPSAMKKS